MPGKERVGEQGHSEDGGSEGGDPDPDAAHLGSGESSEECTVFRTLRVVRSAIDPRIVRVAEVTGDGIGQVADKGFRLSGAVIGHARRHVEGSEVIRPPETGAGEVAPLE